MAFKPGKSGNPKGRKAGTPNKVTKEMREALTAILNEEIGELPEYFSRLNTKDKISVVIKLLEFVLPRLKSIESSPEANKDDEPLFDMGRLTFEERQGWYALYDKACGKTPD